MHYFHTKLSQTEANRKSICVSFFILLAFLSGFRWDVGIDWMAYYQMFSGNALDNDTLREGMEPINLIVCSVLQYFGYGDSRYWIWIMAIIITFFISKSIYLFSPSVFKSFILFVIIGFFFDSLNTIRQFCAISITMYAWLYIFERNLFKYIFWILLALCFHSSAIIMIPIYYIYNLQFNRNQLKLLLLIGLIIAPISTIIAPTILKLLPFDTAYKDDSVIKYATGSGNILSYLRMIFPTIIFIFIIKFKSFIYKNKYSVFFVNMSLIGIWLNLAFPTTQLVIRLSYYFQIALIILIPMICNNKFVSYRNRKVVWYSCVTYYSLFLLINYVLKPIAKIYPYHLKFDLLNIDLITLLIILIIFLSIITIGPFQKLPIKRYKQS